MSTTADLDRLESIATAATPGKRVVRDEESSPKRIRGIYFAPIPVDPADGSTEWWDAVRLVETDCGVYPPARPDAEFIAACDRETILELVQAARRDMLFAVDRLAPVVDVLRRLLPFTEGLCDMGPQGEGWKSDTLSSVLAEAESIVSTADGEGWGRTDW